ncbi:MAG: formylglycine-generating enzyme family protein [Desulfovibrionaceae bacterium]
MRTHLASTHGRPAPAIRLVAVLVLLTATLSGCVCFTMQFISKDHKPKRMIAEFKCQVYQLREHYLDELDRVQCCGLDSINKTMAEGDKLLVLMDRLKRDIDQEHNKTRQELQAYFHALLVSSRLHVYSAPERGMFETSEEYEARKETYERRLGSANQTSAKAVRWVEKERDDRLLQLEIEAAQWRIKMLKPFVDCLLELQKQKFLMPELPVDIELQKPDPDKGRFPMAVKTRGQQWSRHWDYAGESAGWTFWKTRSRITAQAWVQMAPHNTTAGWAPTAVDVANAVTEQERRIKLDPPGEFGAVASFREEQKSAVADLRYQHREQQVKIGFTEPVTGMQFIWVKAGCYQMGCGDWDKQCRANEKPEHKVCLPSFLISRYEVTQKQWRKVMGENPSAFAKGPDFPLENATWSDARKFAAALNAMSPDTHHFRLPTEAEWEYACRSQGQNQVYAGGGEAPDAAWYRDNSGKTTHSVGQKAPNSLGISDMSGNVGEWVQDSYDSGFYGHSPVQTPVCDNGTAGLRVIRGGSWNSPAADVRCTARHFYYAGKRGDMVGFRLVMELKR